MNKSLKSISILSLTAMLLMSMALAIKPTHAGGTVLYVDPASNIFYTDTTHVGDEFTVFIKVANVTDMFAYEFKISWDNTTLLGLSATRPSGHFLEPVIDPANYFVPVWTKKSLDATHQYWHLGYTLLAPETGKSGSGVLVELRFRILKDPPWKGMVSSALDLFDTKLSNTVPEPIPHTPVDGVFEFHWKAPTTKPYLSVVPATKTIPAGPPIVGTADAFFTVDIWINNVDANWWLIASEFKLAYNDTLINFTSIAVAPWLDAFGDIYMVPPIKGHRGDGLAYIHTAVVLLPHDYPPSEWWWPISGSGALVTITFEVIHQEALPWSDQTPLDLYDIKFSDINAEPVPQNPAQDGLVKIEGYIVGRMIDLYVCNYPAPYGGQGPNKPSDMFWPQKEVCLCANVTYNLWPVQNKVVSFEVHDPQGNLVTILTAVSDKNGVACTSYRIPWPCENPEDLFGIWTITATVDIACTVVNDTLSFHFDYLVRWVNVTTDKTAYAHGEYIKVTVDYESYAIQHYNVTLTTVIHDELNYPFDSDYLQVTIGDLDVEKWCQYTQYSNNFTLFIPKWAAAGIAKIYVNAFTDWPWAGGYALVPTYTPPPQVIIKPE